MEPEQQRERLCTELFDAARRARPRVPPEWEEIGAGPNGDGLPKITHAVVGTGAQFVRWRDQLVDDVCHYLGFEHCGAWTYQWPLLRDVIEQFYSPRKFVGRPGLLSVATCLPATRALVRRYSGTIDPLVRHLEVENVRHVKSATSRIPARFAMTFGAGEPAVLLDTGSLAPGYPEKLSEHVGLVLTNRTRRVAVDSQTMVSLRQDVMALVASGIEDLAFIKERELMPSFRPRMAFDPDGHLVYARTRNLRMTRLCRRGSGREAWGHTVMWSFSPEDGRTDAISTARNDFRFNIEKHFPELLPLLRSWIARTHPLGG